jgi:hypothetical protein
MLYQEKKLNGLFALAIVGTMALVVGLFALGAFFLDDWWKDDCFGLLVMLGMFLPLIVFFLVYNFWRYNPRRTARQLRLSLALRGDVNELIERIDDELADAPKVEDLGFLPTRIRYQTRGQIVVTRSWLLWFGWSSFRFLPLADLIWFYKRVDLQPNQLFLRDHRIAYLVCLDARGETHALRMTCESYLDDALEVMARHRPEALFGFQGEWEELADLGVEKVQAAVNQRKVEFEKLNRYRRGSWIEARAEEAIRYLRRNDPWNPPVNQ